MKYNVSGMFTCEVDADNWQEAKVKGTEKAHKGEAEIYIMSAEKEGLDGRAGKVRKKEG